MLACHVPTAKETKGVNAKLVSMHVTCDGAIFSLVPLRQTQLSSQVFPHEADLHLHLHPGMQRYERMSSA